MIKSKTESPTTKLKTLLLKLSEYTMELKYQKGSEMHTNDTLSRHHTSKLLTTFYTKLHRTFIHSFSGKSLCTQNKDIICNDS